MLAIEPGNPARVYMATEGTANGPTYYDSAVPDGTLCNTMCARLAGESTFGSRFQPVQHYESDGAVDFVAGASGVLRRIHPSGVTMVFMSRRVRDFYYSSRIAVTCMCRRGSTATTSWHRLDGEDVSVAHLAGHHSNILFVHMDPHGIAFTDDFEIVITPATGVSAPYNQNSVLSQYVGGTLWMANDGGVVWTADGGKDANSWNWPLGLNTLDPVNIAGLFGIGDTPALYFGCGDNDDFFTLDGGGSWGDPGDSCGDCDAWFTDTATADRVIQFLPRSQRRGNHCEQQYVAISRCERQRQQDICAFNTDHLRWSASETCSVPIVGVGAAGISADCEDAGYGGRASTWRLSVRNQDLNIVATLLRTTAIRSILQVSDWLDPSKASPVDRLCRRMRLLFRQAEGIIPRCSMSGMETMLPARCGSWMQVETHGIDRSDWSSACAGWLCAELVLNPYDPDEIYVLDYGGMEALNRWRASWLITLR